MDSLISLAALIEPRVLDPFVTAPRVIVAADLPELADLYKRAYPSRTLGQDTDEAASRMSAILKGTRGALIGQASLLTHDPEGRISAAILTVKRTFRSDKPPTAFIAELFTHPDHRRQHLAETLLSYAMQALHEAGHKTLAVTVSSSNAAAIALYLSRDFRRFTPAIPDLV
jgi:N-alpha-acetyltransferase 10/11